MEQTKEYYAFISYKREDEKWAKWLAYKLEHYHLPTTLNGKDLPKNLRPIFRDVDELSAGNLPKQISQALSISKNLIVVCSPRSAKSSWVDKEITDFIKIKEGKADNIYPFIIEGVPFSKDADTECFPEALRNLSGNEERLGGNVNEQGGRNAAVVKIIAGMLGIGFDSLWQKYEKEKRKKRFSVYCVITGILVFFVFLAFFFRIQNRQLLLAQSQFIAEKAEKLIEKGDSYLAQLLLLEVLPDGSFDDRPLAIEAELALRKALKENTRKLPCSDIAYIDIALSPDGNYAIGITETDTAYIWKTDNGQLYKKIFLDNYPSDFYDLPKNLRGIVFLSFTRFCYADSIAHVWDMETGRHIQDIELNQLVVEYKDIIDSKPIVYTTENRDIWDINEKGDEKIVRKSDGNLYVVNNKNSVLEKIENKEALFAFFTPDPDEILIIINDSILSWSRTEHRVCRILPCRRDDYPYSSNWEMSSVYFNKDMTKMVINNYIHGGKYDSVENWVLYDLGPFAEEPIISYSPILFSPDGKMCIYNKADLFMENADYCIMDIGDENINSCVEITTLDEQANYWNWFGNNGKGELIAYNDDTLLYFDDKNFSPVNKDKQWKGNVESFSLNKKYFVTTHDKKIEIYTNDQNLMKTIDYNQLGDLTNVEVSSDGKYMLSCHATFVDTLYSDINVKEALVFYHYYLWDISNSTKTMYKQGCYDDFVYLSFSSDGKFIISSSGEVYDVRNGNLKQLQDSWSHANGIRASQDGNYYVIWNGTEVAIWNSHNMKLLWKFSHGDPYAEIGDVEFSPNGKELLVDYRYGVHILNLETGKVVDSCTVGELSDAFYDTDGQHIYMISSNGCFRYDYPSLEELIRNSKMKLNGRGLTTEERVKYHLK